MAKRMQLYAERSIANARVCQLINQPKECLDHCLLALDFLQFANHYLGEAVESWNMRND